jgi:SAM-dependent methyltransferase
LSAHSDITDVRLDQAKHRDWAVAAGPEWVEAEALYHHLVANTNHVDAARAFRWDDVLPENAVVLDLACGAGWLTGLLTQNSRVERVVAWDASMTLLERVLPETIRLVGGNIGKVERICGEFTPIVLADDTVDVVALSSGFHHCPDPDTLLAELARVVRKRGATVLLNEVPYAVGGMMRWITTTAVAAAVNAISNRVTLDKGGHLAANHILYDETLGDRALTRSQWRRLFGRHPFQVESIDSGLPPYKPSFQRRRRFEHNLTHFVLRPLAGADAPRAPGAVAGATRN